MAGTLRLRQRTPPLSQPGFILSGAAYSAAQSKDVLRPARFDCAQRAWVFVLSGATFCVAKSKDAGRGEALRPARFDYTQTCYQKSRVLHLKKSTNNVRSLLL